LGGGGQETDLEFRSHKEAQNEKRADGYFVNPLIFIELSDEFEPDLPAKDRRGRHTLIVTEAASQSIPLVRNGGAAVLTKLESPPSTIVR
jgi:hypothetical protein